MGITNLARQRRHIMNLHLAKDWLEKWKKVHSQNRDDLEIAEIIPYADPKMWNIFLIRCNFVDSMLVYALEEQGFKIVDIKPCTDWFYVRVMEDPDPMRRDYIDSNRVRMEKEVQSEQLTIAINRYLKDGHW